MEIEKFVVLREYLYHLTHRDNIPNIKLENVLYSTNEIINSSDLTLSEKKRINSERRPNHISIQANKVQYVIRDQKPISYKSLSKCLKDNWQVEDFISLLNDRVFFWPNLDRLFRHFNRYEDEGPKIIKCKAKDLFAINKDIEFCRINSGAPRPIAALSGLAVPRGRDTFQNASDFNYRPRDVAEVVFLKRCVLPEKVWIAGHPNGPWNSL